MQHAIGRNKQLIQQHLAATQAGAVAGARQRSGTQGTVQAAEADSRSHAPAAAHDAEAILDRLECHQWGAHRPSADGSSSSSTCNGGVRRPAEAGAAAAQAAHVLEQPSQSTSRPYGGWEEHGGSSNSGGNGQQLPRWEHAARKSRGSAGGSGASWKSQPESTEYEDDFETASEASRAAAP